MGAVSLWTRPPVLHLMCRTSKRAPSQTSTTLTMNESETLPAVGLDSWTSHLSLHNDRHVNTVEELQL